MHASPSYHRAKNTAEHTDLYDIDAYDDHAASSHKPAWLAVDAAQESEYAPLALSPSDFTDAFAYDDMPAHIAHHAKHADAHARAELKTSQLYAQRGEVVDIAA